MEKPSGRGSQGLRVYDLALRLVAQVDELLAKANCTGAMRNQLPRAAESVLLNVGEGGGHYSPGRKMYLYQTAHGSAQECIAALIRLGRQNPTLNVHQARHTAEMISKMLMALIHTQEARRPPPRP